MANKLATTTQKQGLTSYLGNPTVKQTIANVIGEKNVTKFVSSIISAVQTTPALKECTNGSILNGALLGQALELTPSPQLGMFYLVPYDNKGSKEAQFQLGYKGLIQLAIRSGQYRKIVATEVKEGEVSNYNPITEEFTLTPITDPVKRAKSKTVGYYAMFELVNGFRKEIYWTKEAMDAHAMRYSNGYRSDVKKGTQYTFWSKDFDGMAKKTLLRQLISKWGIMSIEMERAYTSDMAVIRDDGSADYVDNQTDVVEEVKTSVKKSANSEDFIEAEVIEVEPVKEKPKAEKPKADKPTEDVLPPFLQAEDMT